MIVKNLVRSCIEQAGAEVVLCTCMQEVPCWMLFITVITVSLVSMGEWHRIVPWNRPWPLHSIYFDTIHGHIPISNSKRLENQQRITEYAHTDCYKTVHNMLRIW